MKPEQSRAEWLRQDCKRDGDGYVCPICDETFKRTEAEKHYRGQCIPEFGKEETK